MHKDRYKLADGTIREKVQPKYNCFQRAQKNKGGRDCDGQSLHLAETVDAIDTAHMELLGYDGASYELYEDDGIHGR